MTDIFAADYRDRSYWWDDAPRPAPSTETPPARVDVLVIGSGYTGLMAARETARGGRSTLVIDAQDAGFGCSSRNGGQVSTSIKPDLATLSGRYNQEIGFGIRKEGMNALDCVADLIESEKLDCDWRRVGRFHAAHNPRQYEALVALSKSQPKGLEVPMEVVPAAEQRREIGSDYYHGGIVYPQHASLHPGKYHLELMRIAKAAGVQVIDHCPATNIARDGSGFTVTTAKGKITARDVVVATNGYTRPLTPWQRRRVIPIGSYIIATEPWPKEKMLALIPRDRALSDTRKLVFYYRLSPDQTRILFGGRVAYMENNPRVSAPRLHDWMTRIFPQLKPAKVTHSWMGYVAYTFDTLPHIGKQDGLHYAMGYCGSGISLATYFGMRIGQQVLGRAEGRTPLDNIPFPTRPLYSGNPWFLAPSIFYYRLRDKLPI
ncbi:MAG TPA: FAD-binding oxidoreductase [Dongiaceae bacterium]|nr:FAD-binding oxidoreductase [Dongiaceae bacterium]